MLSKAFERLNWQQAVVLLGLFGLAGYVISQMPAELWSKIPSGIYWALGGSAGLVGLQAFLGKLIHPAEPERIPPPSGGPGEAP